MVAVEFGAAVGSLTALGAVFGAGLAYASRKFHVEVDPRVEAIAEALPGSNCGACGHAGCAAYADAIVRRGEAIDLCAPGGSETIERISAIMGVKATKAEPQVARLHCNGGCQSLGPKVAYVGIEDCKAAAQIQGGPQTCAFGCLGLGTCAVKCPFDAITMVDGLPVVDEALCTGCGACAKECPKDLFEMVPQHFDVFVRCASQDKGAVAKSVCTNPCIGCKKCSKVCPVDAITIDPGEWLAKIDYEKCVNCGKCAEACPTGTIEDQHPPRGVPEIDEDACIRCVICSKACPVGAISGEKKEMRVIDVEQCIGCEECARKCPKDAITMHPPEAVGAESNEIRPTSTEDRTNL